MCGVFGVLKGSSGKELGTSGLFPPFASTGPGEEKEKAREELTKRRSGGKSKWGEEERK